MTQGVCQPRPGYGPSQKPDRKGLILGSSYRGMTRETQSPAWPRVACKPRTRLEFAIPGSSEARTRSCDSRPSSNSTDEFEQDICALTRHPSTASRLSSDLARLANSNRSATALSQFQPVVRQKLGCPTRGFASISASGPCPKQCARQCQYGTPCRAVSHNGTT